MNGVGPLLVAGAHLSHRNGNELQQAINAAIASGAPSFTIGVGDWVFTSDSEPKRSRPGVSLLIAGASNLRLSGAGPNHTSLWFNPGFGIDVEDCQNVTLEGFAVDTLTPAFSQGELLSLDLAAKRATLHVEATFPLPNDASLFNQTCPDGSGGICGEIKAVFWDPATRRMLQSQQMQNPMGSANCSERTCTVGLAALDGDWVDPPPPGTLLTLSPRLWASKYPIPTFYKGTIGVYNCSGSLFQDIDTFGGGDMVWVEHMGEGGNTYRRVRVTRRAAATGGGPLPYAPRLLAANDDGFHSMSTGVGPTVEDSELSFIADDFLNVHNRLLVCTAGFGPSCCRVLPSDPSTREVHGAPLPWRSLSPGSLWTRGRLGSSTSAPRLVMATSAPHTTAR